MMREEHSATEHEVWGFSMDTRFAEPKEATSDEPQLEHVNLKS